MKKYLFVVLLSLSFSVRANYYKVLEVLKYVESYNDTLAIGDSGRSWGILQIQRATVADVNRYFGTCYTHYDMFDAQCAMEVANLYLKMGVDRYVLRYGHYPSEKRIVQMHNFGIYQTPYDNGYYKKFLKFKKRITLKEGERWIESFEGRYSVSRYGIITSYTDLTNITKLVPEEREGCRYVQLSNGEVSVGEILETHFDETL